jgi:hypothetical protein
MAKSKIRRSLFVPRILVRGAALASVIPACAVVACGSNQGTGPSADAGTGTRTDSAMLGVAAVAYFAYDSDASDVADVGYQAADSGTPDAKSDVEQDARDGASDAILRPDVFLGVAAVAYPAYESGPPDRNSDAHDGASDAIDEPDVLFSVADAAYQVPHDAGRG